MYNYFDLNNLSHLWDKIVNKIKNSINTEIDRAKSAESSLQTQINKHVHDERYYTESEVDSKISDINNSISSHTSNTSNPHSVTKAQVGLGNVENKSSATIRGEITKSNVTTALGYTPLNQSLKGSASGLAELDSNGKVPSSQLPSFVDDVVEGYLSGGKFYKESAHTTEISGETGKIYIDLSTEKTYRWSGSAFVVISETLALGETSSTAYRGDRGKTAYDHSQSTHARTDATKVEKSSTNGNIKINGTETTVYTHPSGTNPHGTTKSDVGLGNVGNFKAVSTVANQGLSDTEKANARANIGAGASSFSGSYNDLTNKPTIPTNNNQLTNGAGYITSSGTAKTISDTLPISKGGTGQTTGEGATNALINSLGEGTDTPSDNDYYISQYAGGGTTHRTYYRRPVSALWNYIKSKLSTVATSGSYNDLSNKPTIPTVGNGTITITQNGTTKGTFTTNQSGNTTIALTDNNTNTTYSAGTGLSLSGTTFNHKNSVTAGTAQGDASKTLTFGGTFTIPTVTYDAQGHITGKGTTTMTMPANPNTDTKNTAGSTDTSSKIFLVGATSQAANPQTYSDNQVYAANGQLNGNSMRVAEKVTMQYNSSTESLDFVFK